MTSSGQHSDQTLWVPRQEVRSQVEPGGGTVMNLHTGKYYALNPVGALIWNELETGASRRSAGMATANAGGCPRARCVGGPAHRSP